MKNKMKFILIYLCLFNLGNLIELPEEYDVRERYKEYNCKSFYDIRDQKDCGGCWAFSTAEVISDKHCIHTKGKYQFLFSEMELLTCCKTLNDNPKAGCGGGDEYYGFHYWVTRGLPLKNCKAFLFDDGEEVLDNSEKLKCRNTCDDNSFMIRDRGYLHSFITGGEEEIKKEIYNNGPVTAGFDFYNSFFYYWNEILPKNPNAIYENFDLTKDGGHSVKIIGWGIDKESNTKYWLCVNSWGKDEGHSGVFRFIRGINNCGIESNVNAGYYLDKIIASNTEAIIVYRDNIFNFKNLNEDYE